MPTPDKFEYAYAIIRVVPQVEREEFLNVGIILYSRQQQFLQVRYSLDEERLLTLFPKADVADIRMHLHAYEAIARGESGAGPIASLDIGSRFRWLTAKRSTVIQSSDVHPGLCKDGETTLEKLHRDLVMTD
jgi:Protein of unknown function (DUF3037)